MVEKTCGTVNAFQVPPYTMPTATSVNSDNTQSGFSFEISTALLPGKMNGYQFLCSLNGFLGVASSRQSARLKAQLLLSCNIVSTQSYQHLL